MRGPFGQDDDQAVSLMNSLVSEGGHPIRGMTVRAGLRCLRGYVVLSCSQTTGRRVESDVMLLAHYPKTWIGCSWLISLSVALFVFVLAEFGGPSWIFVLCGIWLWSVGLPTTLSLLILAWLWGKVPGVGTPPLSAFAVCAVLLSLIAQTMFFSRHDPTARSPEG